MAPTAVNQGLIHAQIVCLLKRHIADQKLPRATDDAPGVQSKANPKKNLRIPETAATCSILESGLKTLPEPMLLVEVLSPSNRAETWSNVWIYLTIPSLHDVLIVEGAKCDAKFLQRLADRSWPDTPLAVKSELRLASLDLSVSVAEVYEGVPLG